MEDDSTYRSRMVHTRDGVNVTTTPRHSILITAGWETCPHSGHYNAHPSCSRNIPRQIWLDSSHEDGSESGDLQHEVVNTSLPNSCSRTRGFTTPPTVAGRLPSSSSIFKLCSQHPPASRNCQTALLRVDNKSNTNANNANANNANVNGSARTAACGESISPTNTARQDKAGEGGAKQRTQRAGSYSPPRTMPRSNKYPLGRRSVYDLRRRRPSIRTRPRTDEPMEEASCSNVGIILRGTLVHQIFDI